MAAAKKFGTLVRAFPLDGGGEKVGFWIRESGDKAQIQVGDTIVELAYREPDASGHYDEAGPNGTYCKAG